MFRRILIVLISFLLFCFVSAECYAKSATKKTDAITVEIQTRDEMMLSGTLTIPAGASVKNKVPVVIMLHSLGGSRSVYDKLAPELKAKNIAALSIDLRGHALSTTKLSGKKTYWQNYSNKVYQKYITDIQDIVLYLQNNYVALDSNRIGIVAADVSANASIIATGKIKKQVKTLVLFTPMMSFKGLSPAQHLMYYGNHPVMIIAAQSDITNYNNAKIISKYAVGYTNFISVPKGGTGDVILKTNPALNKSIALWFEKYL